MSDGFKIPWEAADAITLGCLQDHYKMAKEHLDQWYEGKGWLHREDVEGQSVLMFHLKAVIEYYGGSAE